MLHVGFIGAGEQGLANLLPALMQVEDVKVAAVCDRDPARAARAAKFVGGAPAFAHYEAMLEERELDAIVMACPPQLHREVAMAAMARNIHVFVEKPPCIETSELQELVRAQADNGVVTGVGMNFRFSAVMANLVNAMNSKAHGHLVRFEIKHLANKPRAPLWGCTSVVRSFLLAQTIHAFDLSIMLGGSAPTRITKEIQREGDALLLSIQLRFPNGVTGSVLTGSMFPYFDFDLTTYGSESCVMHVDKMWDLTVRTPGTPSALGLDGKRWRGGWHPSPLDSGYRRSGYLGELEAFFQAIRQQSRFAADFEALLPTYAIIDAISAET